jgi:uncharacterized protein
MEETSKRSVQKIRRIPLWSPAGRELRRTFADTGYWIALLNPTDELHIQAHSLARELEGSRIVTTEMVLVELLNHLGSKGHHLRQASAAFVEQLRAAPNVSIAPQTPLQFTNAFRLYSKRLDKDWSLTDCSSFLLMQQNKITDALAHDVHFQQAGFKTLLTEL